uniref:Probable E3 ubiquitin-protein ligase HERC4 n=1 Tax=Petromyzon marinus TaxID=7757 RepID=A0AAJ7UBC4_PETMA|nr:probable E3 ubiquitin-protein ligase HERC4 [Petromyzon marinus]
MDAACGATASTHERGGMAIPAATPNATSLPASGEGPPRLPALVCWRLDEASPSVARATPLFGVSAGGGRVAAACGGDQRLIVLAEDGTALECGVSGDGFQAVPAERLTQVSCGEHHAVALTGDGQLITWGGRDAPRATVDSQLAPKQWRKKSGKKNKRKPAVAQTTAAVAGDARSVSAPRPVNIVVDAFRRVTLVQVSCGAHHTLALSSASEVFAWGTNDRGQLGLGDKVPRSDPLHVVALCGIPLRALAAGAAHSLALTLTGGVFVWGANAHGQLGLDHLQDACEVVRLESLRARHVVQPSCGDRHTALLTKEGTVLILGGAAPPAAAAAPPAAHAGAAAAAATTTTEQLAHSSVVTECGISGISQIACSRFHTAALCATSRRIYLLATPQGPGEQGGTTELELGGVSPGGPAGTAGIIVRDIFAGGSRVYATCCSAEESRGDPTGTRAPGIFTVTPELSRKLMSKSTLRPVFERQMDVIFSSAACLNGSFLLSQRQSPDVSLGLNLEEAKQLLENLHTKQLSSKVSNLLCEFVVPSLEKLRPDEDSLRVLALLLLFPGTADSQKLTAPVIAKVVLLPDHLRKLFEEWLAHLPKPDFLRMLKASTNLLLDFLKKLGRGGEMKIPPGLKEFLQRLHEINKNSAEAVEDLHEPRLSEFISEMAAVAATPLANKTPKFMKHFLQKQMALLEVFVEFPFLLDSHGRITLFEWHVIHQLQHYSYLQNLYLLKIGQQPLDRPSLPLQIRRSNLLGDAVALLRIPLGTAVWLHLNVWFVGEAVAGPGVNAEFFLLFMEALVANKEIGFLTDRESNLLWFSEEDMQEVRLGQTPVSSADIYWALGVVCGLAVYNRVLIDFPFPLALYKKLLGVSPDLSDLLELSPRLGRSMTEILKDTNEHLEDTLCRTFTYQYEANGKVLTRELIPGGRSTMVTQRNKREYVERFVHHRFCSDAVQRKFERFESGFKSVCEVLRFRLLSPRELRDVAFGKASHDWPALEQGVLYVKGFSARHNTVKMFWEVFRELTDEQKKRFLIFVTGTDRVPLSGMNTLRITFSMAEDPEGLPQAHTCFRTFYLPAYGDKTDLRNKLSLALEQCFGFAPLE